MYGFFFPLDQFLILPFSLRSWNKMDSINSFNFAGQKEIELPSS
jgi:hypothetical protein